MTAPDRLPEDRLLPRDTRRSLPIALLRAREAVMSRFRPLLAKHEVTEQQWRVIRTLGEVGSLEANELAERACVLAPSLTRIIKSLEDRGLIARTRHESDGRRVLLTITPTGLALIRAVAPESAKIFAELEARYGRERIDALLDQLEELTAALSEDSA
ncbi:homoprotocatechuate degradation operon regulator HpaR [Mesorhizobium xinjiangense]|uniref:homoprotocatechuate degradation operon regulator HpaR n=1 Tax=Mesorhizobium xinjiangense TaxID=2678685 RepID=UPI0012EED665|nr:homoprotocatechuate degradation operon regulator HpaR [Mesorhizobium xinjiangense]